VARNLGFSSTGKYEVADWNCLAPMTRLGGSQALGESSEKSKPCELCFLRTCINQPERRRNQPSMPADLPE